MVTTIPLEEAREQAHGEVRRGENRWAVVRNALCRRGFRYRGRPAHVLLSIEDYRKLTGEQMTLAEAVAQQDVPDFDFEPPRADDLYRPADLS